MDAKMKILKPERPGGSLIVQIIAVFLLLLFIGCIYIPLYYWNIPFLNHLFNTWWLWVLPSLPAIWFLWLIVDSVIAFHTKHCLLHLIDFQVDETKGNIQITFKLNGFPEPQITEEMLQAKYQPIYGRGGPPIRFKKQQAVYNITEDSYKITINASELLIKIKDIFIYVEQKRLIPYHCIYRVHRFSYDWRNPRF
jgi:hypothetical protein